MSFFRTEQTEMTDQECLVEGLREMGLGKKFEVLAKKRKLVGYGRGEAEIILKKGAVGNHYELGFAKQANGTFALIQADDDHFDVKGLRRAYAERKSHRIAAAKGMKFVKKVSTVTNGKVNTKLIFQAASSN